MHQGVRILLWFQGTAFFSFFVRAFCMRLLNSIHDEIGNRSFAWFCLDFSLEIAVQTKRLKGLYNGDPSERGLPFVRAPKHMLIAS